MYTRIAEGRALLIVPSTDKISREMPVFYNPFMKLNRDISIALLNSVEKQSMQLADPLAGTGVRSIRFILELKKGKIRSVSVNDASPDAAALIKRNLKLNRIKSSTKVSVKNEDASLFLLKGSGFDYIDIDPFGYPGKFLPAAVQRLARGGILAVTATDTSALAGSAQKACLRKYWAKPLRNECMHETGLRILVRFVQLIGAQYEKALTPLFCYSKQHYMRSFFICEKGKKKVDSVLCQHGLFSQENECAGPLWTGNLWNRKLVKRMLLCAESEEARIILKTIVEESGIFSVGFYDIHTLCKKHRLAIPKKEELIKAIRKQGFKAAHTHFSPTGIRSDISKEKLITLIKTM